MPASSGFQLNTTILAAFWRFVPDPADQTGKEIMVEVNGIQYIESTRDHTRVWIYYAQTDVSTSQRAYILDGPVAIAFMNDFGGLF